MFISRSRIQDEVRNTTTGSFDDVDSLIDDLRLLVKCEMQSSQDALEEWIERALLAEDRCDKLEDEINDLRDTVYELEMKVEGQS